MSSKFGFMGVKHSQMTQILARLGITAVLALAAAAISVPQAQAVTISVDCDPPANETIQSAVNGAVDGDRIEVSGTCNERVTINKNRIELIGLAGAEIIAPAGSGRPAIRIRGLNVLVEDFSTITGENKGILVTDGSAVVRNNIIKDSIRDGISIGSGATGRITDNTITNNAGPGIVILFSGAGLMENNTITNNQGDGIRTQAAAASIIIGNTITDNAGSGIAVIRNGHARLSRTGGMPAEANILERNGEFWIICELNGSLEVAAPQVFGTGADGNVAGEVEIDDSCALDGDAAETLDTG